MKINFSAHQELFFSRLLDGEGNLVLQARAGSGKTFTLKHAIHKLSEQGVEARRMIYVAFNKHVEKEAKEKLGKTAEVRTTHSCGLRMVLHHFFGSYRNYPKLDRYIKEHKYRNIVSELADRAMGVSGKTKTILPFETLELLESKEARRRLVSVAVRLIDLVRNNLVPRAAISDSIDEFIVAHDLEVDPGGFEFLEWAVPRACSMGLSSAKRIIDFGDMVWLPNVLDLSTPWFEYVLVDEAQDLTRAQLGVTKRLRARSARMVFVGDDRQAIYGFAGADVNSFRNIIADLSATVLPLPICYRSPQSHLALARQIVPDIEAAPGASVGVMSSCGEEELAGKLERGDLVLCRTTAPLISACLEAISEGVNARVRGRDIGALLFSTAKKIAKLDGFVAPLFVDFADQWLDVQIEALGEDADEATIDRLEDRVACLKVIVDMGGPVTSLDELEGRIDAIFSDKKPAVWFSTVHRAKGLEERRVFILKPELLPHPRARQDWQKVQEENLRYIAYTRSQEELVFVEASRAKALRKSRELQEFVESVRGAA